MPSDNDHLRALYPFLHGDKLDATTLDHALLDSVRQKAALGIDAKQKFFDDNAAAVVNAARAIAAVYQRGGRMLAMGNGGSSCDAAHFSVEFLHPVTAGRPALTVINLVADTAMMTAVGNDVGFEHIFVRQITALARAEDGLIGFSTSGNSSNLIKAFGKAKKMGLNTIGLTGGDGGQMTKSAEIDHCLVVATDSIHRVQEVHVATYHILWDLVHTLLSDERGNLQTEK